MPVNRKSRPKATPKSEKSKSIKDNAGPKASEEFGGENLHNRRLESPKKETSRRIPGNIIRFEKKDWDDGPAWYAQIEGHDKLAKINRPSGRALAEVFGDDMSRWKGQKVHVTPMNYNTGWGVVIDPIEKDIDEDLLDDDDEYEEVEGEDDESVD